MKKTGIWYLSSKIHWGDHLQQSGPATAAIVGPGQARSHWLGWSGFNLTTFTAIQFMQH